MDADDGDVGVSRVLREPIRKARTQGCLAADDGGANMLTAMRTAV